MSEKRRFWHMCRFFTAIKFVIFWNFVTLVSYGKFMWLIIFDILVRSESIIFFLNIKNRLKNLWNALIPLPLQQGSWTCHRMFSPTQVVKFFEVSVWFKCMRRGGGAQWANSGGEVSITSLKSITSENTPKSSQKLPPPTTHAPPTTTKPPPPPQKNTTMTITARSLSFWNYLGF